MPISLAEWHERRNAAYARIGRLASSPEPGLLPGRDFFQAGNGLPISIFPLDGAYHSVLMLMESTILGSFTKAAMVMGQGTSSEIAYNPQYAVVPCDILTYKDENTGQENFEVIPYFSPNSVPGHGESIFPAPPPPKVVLPDDGRAQLLAFLARARPGMFTANIPTEVLLVFAQRLGYKG